MRKSRTHRSATRRQNRRKKQVGASPRSDQLRPPFGRSLVGFWVAHLLAFFHGLGRLAREPFGSLLTITIIGIAMALPVGLHLVLKNLQGLAEGWDDSTQISLFLNPSLTLKDVPNLQRRIESQVGAIRLEAKGPGAALAEFRHAFGVSEAVEVLGENPLPVVLVIFPDPAAEAAALEAMTATLQAFPEIDMAQLDLRWVQRLQAITHLGQRATLILASLFSIAVLLTIGNSARIEVERRREEIAVEKLVGATTAFIRRPFLYTGFWLGVTGAATALLLISLAMLLLDGPIRALLRLYDSDSLLSGIDLPLGGGILLAGVLLGVLGSLIAVNRQLRRIEPDW